MNSVFQKHSFGNRLKYLEKEIAAQGFDGSSSKAAMTDASANPAAGYDIIA
jgi:hypothetical protein